MKPGRSVLSAVLAAAMLMTALPAMANDDQPVMVSTKRLSMETALRIARATLEDCRERGYQVGVTVVDRAGQPQVVLRDVLAMELTLRISRQKAYTAMSFNLATSELSGQFDSPVSIAKVEGVLPAAGGLPVNAAGEIVGGVGVSGAPSGEIDEACAQAGIDEVEFDLQMAD